jgi:hypothetical protein
MPCASGESGRGAQEEFCASTKRMVIEGKMDFEGA